MDDFNYKFENYLLKLARSKRMSYEMMHKKKEALFWAMVNMLCIIIVPVLLSFTSFGIPVVKMITNLCLLSNLSMHMYVILRNPKSLEQEMSEDKFSSQQLAPKDKILVKLIRPPKTEEAKPLDPPPSESYESPVATWHQISCDADTKIISIYFKLETGALITPKGVVIKPCRCPVLNYKCRLCPFRAYPLAYFKSWFWGGAELTNEECPYCGVGFVMYKDEYENLLKRSYPLHDCICHCYYCRYAKDRPLQPRVNLIPDSNHCSCICRQCRGIEDIIHGLQPLDDERQFRIFKIPLSQYNEENSHYSLLARETTSNLRQSPIKSQILKNITNIGNCKNFQIHSEVWRRFGINPFNLVTWIANLRAWISNTILKRLVEEMAMIDHKLQWHGLSLIAIGEVGLDILRATACSEQISRNIPSLAQLLPFLKICGNQQYLVQRIRELAVGNNMREFSGQSRGNCRDPMWSDYVPSDSELVMHLVITYFDAMLPPMDLEPRKQTFSTIFFSKTSEMPPQREIAIIQQNACPPSYHVLVKGKICQIPSGHNNIFFALLLFIHCIKKFHQSTLGKTNIGPAGLNMLWIIEDV
ncbi:uncharacterized protein [Halyomorpha halys]|uniref:uncharacterized protein n=1 Tax=Halyomorpha halys TaxID=286706 RepID=UPI0006D4E5F3|nr:uncharacterized protein LOC106681929 [Halyomorpha halys]